MASIRQLGPGDAPELTSLYHEYGWWDDRTEADVRTALAGTPIALGAEVDEELVAGVRVLTDFVYYATVFDLIVASDHRGDGVGEQLLEAVVEHPELREAAGVSLLCREGLVPFYRSVGFERDGGTVEVPEGETEPLVRMVYSHPVSEG